MEWQTQTFARRQQPHNPKEIGIENGWVMKVCINDYIKKKKLKKSSLQFIKNIL